MKYLFILGRNPELSQEEILCYLKKHNLEIVNTKKVSNGLRIEIPDRMPKETLDFLGGTIAIGEVICGISEEELEKQTIYSGTKNKLSYVLWNFSTLSNNSKVTQYLKKRFKVEKLKASHKPLTGSLEMQDKENVKISSGLIDEEYFIFKNEFGRIISKCDYKELERRDMKKPVRRESLAIPPRLAKIMINLSGVKKGETLLDPFCGIGVILQEALLQKIKVTGIDIDPKAIDGAKKNLDWLGISQRYYTLIQGDSRKIHPKKSEVIVTEPYLGETLKFSVQKDKASKMLKSFETLIIGVFNNLQKNVGGKIVFTSPVIRLLNKKRIGCNLDKILRRTKLKLVKSFPDYREDQIVGREISVLER